jgi:polynucleotide 5'-kinase involved in rRNA processing
VVARDRKVTQALGDGSGVTSGHNGVEGVSHKIDIIEPKLIIIF